MTARPGLVTNTRSWINARGTFMFQSVGNAESTSRDAIPTEASELQAESSPTIPDEHTAEDTRERTTARELCLGADLVCPFVSCRYHLLLDRTEEGGIMMLHRVRRKGAPMVLNESARQSKVGPFIDEAVATLELIDETCVLNIAERGPQTLDTVADALGITREGARLWEKSALESAERKRKFRRLEGRD